MSNEKYYDVHITISKLVSIKANTKEEAANILYEKRISDIIDIGDIEVEKVTKG